MPKPKNRRGVTFAKINRELKNKPDVNITIRERKVVFSYLDLDPNQGQSFEEWTDLGLMLQMQQKLRQVCTMTMAEANKQQVIKCYHKVHFPKHSKFTYPKHISESVLWASMHLQGKECIIGHVQEFIFFIVFLDKDHEFWPSKLR